MLPDWDILIFIQKLPKYLVSFWSILKNIILGKNSFVYIWVFLKSLRYFNSTFCHTGGLVVSIAALYFDDRSEVNN